MGRHPAIRQRSCERSTRQWHWYSHFPALPARATLALMTDDARSTALDELLTRYATMVRHIGRTHGLHDADVDEVFQDVRIRLWRARESGENIAAVGTSYVYRTAVSAALDLIRRRRASRGEDLATIENSSDAALVQPVTPEHAVEEAEVRAEVERAVESLAASRRPVVRMYLAGYSREEIARLLGWTEAKTRNLLYRGLADVRERLIQRGFRPEGVR